MNVLLVDDDQSDAELITRLLEKWQPTTIMKAASCEQALDVLKAWPIDCVIMDQRLIGMTGADCVALVRNSYLGALVMLTGFPDVEVAVLAMRNGADNFLSKDHMMTSLVPAVEGAVAHRAGIVESERRRVEEQKRLRAVFRELQDLQTTVRELLRDQSDGDG